MSLNSSNSTHRAIPLTSVRAIYLTSRILSKRKIVGSFSACVIDLFYIKSRTVNPFDYIHKIRIEKCIIVKKENESKIVIKVH